MAQVWQCDRCKVISNNGTVDDAPDGWERRVLPVRGSEGARSDGAYYLCPDCDDGLYRWFHNEPRATSDRPAEGSDDAKVS